MYYAFIKNENLKKFHKKNKGRAGYSTSKPASMKTIHPSMWMKTTEATPSSLTSLEFSVTTDSAY